MNALTAADGVLIPIQTEYYALEGLSQLVNTIRRVREGLNPRLEIEGVLLTMYDARTNLSAQVASEVRRHMNGTVYETVVPRSVRLSEAPSHGLPIALYDPSSRGAHAYARARRRGRSLVASMPGARRARLRPRPWSRRPDPDRRPTSAACSSSPLDRIERNPNQPRAAFDEAQLGELAASIAVHGVIQPLIVRYLADGSYQLIAGERRLRAARLAGLDTIPAVVRDAPDGTDSLELALIENLQRADLNPIETALAYRELIDRFGLTHEAVARQVGKSRVAVSNALRLLDLAPETRQAIVEGRISEGHGRALAAISIPALQRAVLRRRARAPAVRPPDRGARAAQARGDPGARSARRSATISQDLEAQLRGVLATKVGIVRTRRGGRLVIDFYSDEELDRLYSIITRGAGGAAAMAPPTATAASAHPDREVAPHS